MIPSERSGVMFTVDPSTGETDHIVIEAAFGQGEVVVSGQVEPDTYVVDKDGPAAPARPGRIPAFKIVRGPDGADQRVELEPRRGQPPGAHATTRFSSWPVSGLAVEAHYGSPQDTEWAMAGGHTFLVQSRPSPPSAGRRRGRRGPTRARSWSRAWPRPRAGRRASCGCSSSPDEGDRLQAGEILVAPMTSPDWVPTMRRAAALVTDGGGMTCHAAIVSRELGVPCVVGARTATTVLRDGELVTVDGAPGTV